MSTLDEIYATALLYRDNKMCESSVEDSRVEAERLFLELSQHGHAKAMHNYAVLQQKKGNYKLAADWFDKAGLDASMRNIKAMRECGQIKEDLYLVVANDRSAKGTFGPIMDSIYGSAVDKTHLHSFGGNATTCDIYPCATPGAKHLVADVLTFDFAKKYNLKHVLIERLPTINELCPNLGFGKGSDNRRISMERDARVNYFGAVIQNLSKAMEPGAILEIEWDPYTTQWHLHCEEAEEYHILNPFHGFIHSGAAVLGAQCTDPAVGMHWIPGKLHETAAKYGEKFRTEIEFWHSQGAGRCIEEISDRMRAEVDLFWRINMANNRIGSPQLAFVEANLLTDPTEKVIVAMHNAVFDNFNPQLSQRVPVELPDGRKGRVYSANTLVAVSLFGMATNSLCVQNNIPYAKHYLETIGFNDVVIERRTNTHNGRKNVWMVKAVKG